MHPRPLSFQPLYDVTRAHSRKYRNAGSIAVLLLFCVACAVFFSEDFLTSSAETRLLKYAQRMNLRTEALRVQQPKGLALQSLDTPRPKGAISRSNQTFADYLAPFPRSDLIWMALSDPFFNEAGTAHLEHFVSGLPPYKGRANKLVILCMDDDCMTSCASKGWNCYGEYAYNRPTEIFKWTWPKLAGLIDMLGTANRDVLFADSDLYFRRNPFEHMPDLSEYDLQISSDGHGSSVNTGFFYMKPGAVHVQHWKNILERNMESFARDQWRLNEELGSFDLNEQNFTSTQGLKVHVLPLNFVYPYHYNYRGDKTMEPYNNPVAFHATCMGERRLKHILAREYGVWQNVDGYYDTAPKILALSALSGTPQQVLQQFAQFADVALRTNRSLILPEFTTLDLTGYSETSEFPTNIVTKKTYEVLPYHKIYNELRLPLLESHYVQHFGEHQAAAGKNSPSDLALQAALQRPPSVAVDIFRTTDEIVKRLLREDVVHAPAIRLMKWPADISGTVPKKIGQLQACKELQKKENCHSLCRV